MKKFACFMSVFIAMSGSALFAAPASTKQKPLGDASGQPQSAPMTSQTPDCSKLTQPEQTFAAQITDMNNKANFCSQFTMQQRQQAMQMMGQTDASGKAMSADQAVQSVMGTGGMAAPATQQKPRASGGGCPVK